MSEAEQAWSLWHSLAILAEALRERYTEEFIEMNNADIEPKTACRSCPYAKGLKDNTLPF